MFDELYAQENTPLLMEYNAVTALVKDKSDKIKGAAFDIAVMQYESRGSSYIPMSAVAVDDTSIDKIAKTDMNITLETDAMGAQNVYHRYSLFEWRNFHHCIVLLKAARSIFRMRGAVQADTADSCTKIILIPTPPVQTG